MALEVSDDEPVGIKIVEVLVAPVDELLATSIGGWESVPVDDGAECWRIDCEMMHYFAQRRPKELKEWSIGSGCGIFW